MSAFGGKADIARFDVSLKESRRTNLRLCCRWADCGLLWVWDPTRINDNDVRRKPVVVVVNGVVDPIAVVVDLRLRHLHAGKDQTGRRLGQFLARLYFLHLHTSGAYPDDFAIVDLCEDVGLTNRVDLMFAVLLYLFAKQSFPIEMLFLLGECDAGSTDGAR
jgi:hypothetical protein